MDGKFILVVYRLKVNSQLSSMLRFHRVILMKYYEKLRALREEKEPKVTQTELARILNVTQRKISRIETGKAEPCIQDLIALCTYYRVSADYILGLPSDMPYPKR